MACYRITLRNGIGNREPQNYWFNSSDVSLSAPINRSGKIAIFLNTRVGNKTKRMELIHLLGYCAKVYNKHLCFWHEGFYNKMTKHLLNREITVNYLAPENEAYGEYKYGFNSNTRLMHGEDDTIYWEFSGDNNVDKDWGDNVLNRVKETALPRIELANLAQVKDRKQIYDLELAQVRDLQELVANAGNFLDKVSGRVLDGWKKDIKPIVQTMAASMAGNWECFGRSLVSTLGRTFSGKFRQLIIIPQLVHDSVPADFYNKSVSMFHMGTKRVVNVHSVDFKDEIFKIYVPVNWYGFFEQTCRSKLMRFNLPWVDFRAQGYILPRVGVMVLSAALIEFIWLMKSINVHVEQVGDQLKSLVENFDNNVCVIQKVSLVDDLDNTMSMNHYNGYLWYGKIYENDWSDEAMRHYISHDKADFINTFVHQMHTMLMELEDGGEEGFGMASFRPNSELPAALRAMFM